jgi:pimeloyl-ACP methyl ester carboxylesterase
MTDSEFRDRVVSGEAAGTDLSHAMADIEPGLRLHFVTAGAGEGTIVLLHGFPQTWRQWRHVIPALVGAGFCVVAPDYRGAGDSWRPASGYDKRTMAGDIRRLLRDHVDITEPVVLVGHDIGLMVAYAYAQAYRDAVSHLVVVDAPLPGTEVFGRLRSDPRVWHFAFHAARDVAEMLVTGRERAYLQAFFNTAYRRASHAAKRQLNNAIFTASHSATATSTDGRSSRRSTRC